MSLADWFLERDRDLEARTRRERHGQGELTLVDGIPLRATGCTLSDGSFTDAECLLPHVGVPHDNQRVWTRRLPASSLRCRGRLTVDPGKALLFEDVLGADLPPGDEKVRLGPDMERDLGASARIRELVRSEVFATLLYGALCNTIWHHKATGTPWHCSWRHAGGIIAALRSEGDYLDWYCSSGEGLVDLQALTELARWDGNCPKPTRRTISPRCARRFRHQSGVSPTLNVDRRVRLFPRRLQRERQRQPSPVGPAP